MVDSKVEHQIDKFIAVFHRYICQVGDVDFGPEAKRYPKILYFSLLEALSKARFPKKSASAAFSSFLVNHCEWLNGDRFSLPHIVAALERTSDPDFEQLREYAFTNLQHRNLLYAYRSKLSHESREPTISFEHSSDQKPFYESVRSMESSRTSWNLVYPTGFLRASCHTGLESLKRWLLAEAKDPYLQFKFGRFLIERLNDPAVSIQFPLQ